MCDTILYATLFASRWCWVLECVAFQWLHACIGLYNWWTRYNSYIILACVTQTRHRSRWPMHQRKMHPLRCHPLRIVIVLWRPHATSIWRVARINVLHIIEFSTHPTCYFWPRYNCLHFHNLWQKEIAIEHISIFKMNMVCLKFFNFSTYKYLKRRTCGGGFYVCFCFSIYFTFGKCLNLHFCPAYFFFVLSWFCDLNRVWACVFILLCNLSVMYLLLINDCLSKLCELHVNSYWFPLFLLLIEAYQVCIDYLFYYF